MKRLRVCLFGEFRVFLAKSPLEGFEVSKVQELFSYLLLRPEDPHHREALVDLFWRDTSAERGRRYLRKTLWQLQNALEPYCPADERKVLQIDSDWIQFNSEADCWVDVQEFSNVFLEVQNVPGKMLDLATVERVKAAVDLYHGGLLTGWYQEWCLFEREWLQRKYLMLLDKLADYCQANGEYELGLTYVSTLLRYDQTRERSHRRLMRLFYLSGDRSAALQQYHALETILKEELDVEPAKRTQQLYDQIRTEQFDAPPVASTVYRPGLYGQARRKEGLTRKPKPTDSHLSQMQQLNSLLARAQWLVQSELKQLKGRSSQ
jgi:DNA-binding SARP family transcriptional activator